MNRTFGVLTTSLVLERVGFEFFTVVNMKMPVFYVIAPHSVESRASETLATSSTLQDTTT